MNTPITDELVKFRPNQSGGGIECIYDIEKVRNLETKLNQLTTENQQLKARVVEL